MSALIGAKAVVAAPSCERTIAEASTGISFTFGEGVGDVEKETIRDAIVSARDFICRKAGEEVSEFKVFAYVDLDALAEAEASWIKRPEQAQTYRDLWQNATFVGQAVNGAFFIYTGQLGWQGLSSASRFRLVAHEYFHLLQRQLYKGKNPGPTWLTEGSAMVLETLAYSEKTGVGYSNILGPNTDIARNYPGTLADFEKNFGLLTKERLRYAYPLSFVAVDLLSSGGGLDPIVSYYKAIGDGASWQDAFQKSFGQTVESFYQQFGANRP